MKPEDPEAQGFEEDARQRHRAVEETDSSFFVEAAAGTGKTSTLTNRILHLVLEKGPEGPPLPLSRICAITFTEKAAGEMKIRLRHNFEQIASDSRVSTDRLDRAQHALRDLETASISTFHAFAVSLLKERPIEAALDPHFTALDEIRSELFFREVWEPWISHALAERNSVLEKALRNGLTLEVVQNVARIVRLNGHAVRMLSRNSPPTEDQIRENIRELLRRGFGWLDRMRDPNDKLSRYLENTLDWLKDPVPGRAKLSKPGNAGSAANWEGGRETLRAVQDFIREAVGFSALYLNLPAQRLLDDVVGWIIEDFIPTWESRKRAQGLLDFDDQLWLARDLLLKNRAVRREFQARYSTLLIDEFQDTDPVQWEIILLLSSTDLEKSDPSRLQPGQGRLFIVGDPKQSIYRFRNADIETYLGIVDPQKIGSFGLERLQLTRNFRSVPSILRFVDAAFESVMKIPEDGSYQPDYLPFGNHGNRKEELHAPSVHLLGDTRNEDHSSRTVREFLEREASRIAALIQQIHGSESWKVQDSTQKKSAWRVPRFGDIAILLPVLSRADILEDALRDAEIPYVLEGGKFYYARSEVSSAITVLRAVANPNDSIALYGALRSIFFGFSDEDLLGVRIAGQPLNYRAEVPDQSPLYFPYKILRDLHQHRHERRASETFEILLQNTGARETLAARGFQSLANLGKLSRTLRALQGEMTFSQVIGLLSTMDEEGLAESESRLMEERSDAVRIMSIHKAKGLDFPIVFAANLGLKKRVPNKHFLADFHRQRVFGLNFGPKESGLQTPGWQELAEEEKKRENAELARLLYVGLTRARDHLVLCTHTQNWQLREEDEQWIPATEGTRLNPLNDFLVECLSKNNNLARWVDTDSLNLLSRRRPSRLSPKTKDWCGIAQSEYKDLRELLANTPYSQDLQAAGSVADTFGPEDISRDERIPEAAGSRAVRLGIAFHEAMERVDLFRAELTAAWAQELKTRHRLDRENARKLEEMVHTSLTSDLLERARVAVQAGRRILREVPYVRPVRSAAIEEGKIDLLFEEKEGWVLVDYKTDWVSGKKEGTDEFFRGKYAGQVREYVEALQTLPVKVASAYLLLARTGDAIKII